MDKPTGYKKKRNAKNLIRMLTAAVIAVSLLLTCACGKQVTEERAQVAETAEVNTEVTADAGTMADTDPYGAYDPAITIEMVHQTGDQTVKFKDGDTFENNVFTRAYKDMLGIDVKYLWVASGDDEAQKTNIMIASDSLPDIFMLDDLVQYEQLVKADRIEDLTSVFDQYATEYTKSIYSGEYAREIDAVRRNGKMYTIPWFNDYNAIISMVWIRSDWLKNLNLPVPRTGEELLETAEAFTSKDPDENGKADTYGIPMNNAGIESSYWNMFHSYPDIWIKDSTGKLSYGMYGSAGQAAATRKGLLTLQELYKKGVIRKDFATMATEQQSEDIVSGKCGILFGTASRPYFELQNNTKADKNADWAPIAVPSIDGEKQTISANPLNQYGFYVVRKGYEHPEALVKMLNLYNKLENDPETVTQEYLKTYGSFFKAAPVRLYDPHTFFNEYDAITGALTGGDTSGLSITLKQYYDNIKSYIEAGDKNLTNRGNKTGWADMKYYGPEGASSVAVNYNKNGLYIYDEYWGPPTGTFAARQPLIDKKWNQILMDIVAGGDISAFDSFVKEYGPMGGTDIAKEVNEWYDAQPGGN